MLRFIVHPEIGDVVLCPECATTLEVKEAFPLALDWHFEKPFREEESFYSQNWDEWQDETGAACFFDWEWTEKNEQDEQDEWTQLLEKITSEEKAFAYA